MSAPLGYFLHAGGSAARPVVLLGWVFAGIAACVCVIVATLLAIALWHRRRGSGTAPEGHALRWVYAGTVLSVLALFGMTVYMLEVLNETRDPPATPVLFITVTAYQWWWKAAYGGDPAFTTANEIHIPVGRPVQISLQSADVIHSFWVPVLAGKTQVIPDTVNRQWIEADAPGIYRGQCAEYCGSQHAHMALEVVAEPMADFEAWRRAQARAQSAAADTRGEKIFMDNCSACHTVRGGGARGAYGPDLTHLQSRRLIAAGLLENTPDNLGNWVAHAQELKRDSRMPDFSLAPDDRAALLRYLSGLK